MNTKLPRASLGLRNCVSLRIMSLNVGTKLFRFPWLSLRRGPHHTSDADGVARRSVIAALSFVQSDRDPRGPSRTGTVAKFLWVQ